jgi:flagellar basal body-associated protein FliL
MKREGRSRDVLVMIVILLTAFALAMAGYARIKAGQDVRAIRTMRR